MSEEENLKIVDTSHSLTAEELLELKRLVAMSKGAKVIFAIAVGFIGLFGLDKIISLLEKHL